MIKQSKIEKLPDDWFKRFELGVAEFNDGKYYDCHETLEQCWQEQGQLETEMLDPHRQFVQGLIQIAVGYHHLQRDNVKGAIKLLVRGYDRIKNFPLIAYPLDLSAFEPIVQSTIEMLESGQHGSSELKTVARFPKVAHK